MKPPYQRTPEEYEFRLVRAVYTTAILTFVATFVLMCLFR